MAALDDPLAPLADLDAARAAAARRRDNLSAAAWLVASGAAATAMTVAIRMLAPEVSSSMQAFLRSTLGLWVLAPYALDGRLARMRFRRRPLAHVRRGALLGLSLVLGFHAMAVLPIATATILFFLGPIFATALAGPLLGERVGWRRWSAVGVGFLGALLILAPALSGAAALDVGGLAAAVASSACFSLALVLGQPLAREDGPAAVLVSSTAVSAVVTLPFAAASWSPPAGVEAWSWVAVLVLASSLRMYADIEAYRRGEAGFVAPFGYVRLLFAVLAGWFIFAERVDGWTIAGGTVIVVSTLVIARREARLRAQGPSGTAR